MRASRSPGMVRLRGLLIAPAARDWLEAPAAPAVHSLYRSSVNLVDEEGRLLALVSQDSGLGPFALVVRPEAAGFAAAGGFEAHLSESSPVTVAESELTIGPLQVDWAGAAQWKPRPSWEQVGAERIGASLDELRAVLEAHAPAGSFAPLVEAAAPAAGADRAATALATVAEPDAAAHLAATALAAAAEPARQLMAGLRGGDAGAVGEAARRLAGLGGGVTPSGDDYLLGALHALWALAAPAEAEALSRVIVAQAVPRTNLISAAWLRAAGRGEAGNEWHVLAVALASGAPSYEPAKWLVGRGHTSGADALAGFLAAARALLAP